MESSWNPRRSRSFSDDPYFGIVTHPQIPLLLNSAYLETCTVYSLVSELPLFDVTFVSCVHMADAESSTICAHPLLLSSCTRQQALFIWLASLCRELGVSWVRLVALLHGSLILLGPMGWPGHFSPGICRPQVEKYKPVRPPFVPHLLASLWPKVWCGRTGLSPSFSVAVSGYFLNTLYVPLWCVASQFKSTVNWF